MTNNSNNKEERKHNDRNKTDDLQISRTDMNMLIMNYLVTGEFDQYFVALHLHRFFNKVLAVQNVWRFMYFLRTFIVPNFYIERLLFTFCWLRRIRIAKINQSQFCIMQPLTSGWSECTPTLYTYLYQNIYNASEGFKEAALKFQQEAGLQEPALCSSLDERIMIREAVQSGRIPEAIAMVNALHPELLDNDRYLYFHLQVIQYIKFGSYTIKNYYCYNNQ